jgi:predicted MFS family arabinose efflux permease
MSSGGIAGTAHEGAATRVSPWLVLAAAFFVSVVAVMAQFAVPPLMPVLMDAFRIDISRASSLMSVFSITGLLLALPAGLVLGRFGALVTGLVAAGSVVVGSVIAATAPDFGVLLAGRAVQGIGTGLIGVVAPAVVAAAFPPERRGAPMGVWAMWVPVGALLMYVAGPSLALAGGWQMVWWVTAGLAAAALAAWVLVLGAAGLQGGPGGEAAAPRSSTGAGTAGLQGGPGPGASSATRGALADLRLGLSGRDIWLLVVMFALFATASGAANTFIATFLTEERGYDVAGAAAVSGLAMAGMAVGSVLSGFASDRLGSRRLVYCAALLISAPMLVLPYVLGGPAIAVSLFVFGVFMGAVPAAIFASVPEVVPHPGLAGAGMAGIMLGQNAGFVLGPVLFAALLPSLGWAGTAAASGVVVAASAVVGWRVHAR